MSSDIFIYDVPVKVASKLSYNRRRSYNGSCYLTLSVRFTVRFVNVNKPIWQLATDRPTLVIALLDASIQSALVWFIHTVSYQYLDVMTDNPSQCGGRLTILRAQLPLERPPYRFPSRSTSVVVRLDRLTRIMIQLGTWYSMLAWIREQGLAPHS